MARACLRGAAPRLPMLLLVLATTGGLLVAAQAPAPDLNAIPQTCVASGTTLQSACATVIQDAQQYFNVQPGAQPGATSGITQAQVDAYLKQAKPPSPDCCAAACQFNAAFCSCEKSVLDFAVAMTGGSADLYTTIANAFGSTCKFQAFVGQSCPALAARPTTPVAACPAAPASPAPPGGR